MKEILKTIKGFPYNYDHAESMENWLNELRKIISFFKAKSVSVIAFPEDGKPSGLLIDIKEDVSIAFYNDFFLSGHSQEFPKICLVICEKNCVYWHRCVVDYSIKDQGDERLKLIISDAKTYSECGELVNDFQIADTNFDIKSVFSEAKNYRKFLPTSKISSLGIKTDASIWGIIYAMSKDETVEKREDEPTIADLLKANPAKSNELLPFDRVSFLEKDNPLIVPSLKKLHKLRDGLLNAYYVPADGPFLFYGSKEYWLKKVKERSFSQTEANVAVNIAQKMGWIKIL